MKRLSKKAQLMQSMGGIGISIATLVVLLAVTFLVLAEVRTEVLSTDPCGNGDWNYNSTSNCCNATAMPVRCVTNLGLSASVNATTELTSATATIPGWVPLIVLVLIGGLILGLVKAFGDR